MKKRYLAPSVKKAFDILRVVSLSREGMGLSEIARALKMAKSTAHGITSILEELGAVIRDPATRRYELGPTLFELGRRAYSQIDLRVIARPVMEKVMERVQETVFLGMLHNENMTILDVVECRHDFKITSQIGTSIPFLAAATGKALLARIEDSKALEIMTSKGLPKYTEKSITDPALFLEEVKQVRIKGYATDYEEYISGVRAVAAPVNGGNNKLAVIWVVGFKASLDDHKLKTLTEIIMEAVGDIESRVKAQSIIQVGAFPRGKKMKKKDVLIQEKIRLTRATKTDQPVKHPDDQAKREDGSLPEGSEMGTRDIKPLEDMEREYIVEVLEKKKWKIGGRDSAASTLRLHPSTLRSRMKKLGIKRPEQK